MSMGQPWGPWGTSSLLEPSPAQGDSVVSPSSHPGARTGYTMCHSAWERLQAGTVCLGRAAASLAALGAGNTRQSQQQEEVTAEGSGITELLISTLSGQLGPVGLSLGEGSLLPGEPHTLLALCPGVTVPRRYTCATSLYPLLPPSPCPPGTHKAPPLSLSSRFRRATISKYLMGSFS